VLRKHFERTTEANIEREAKNYCLTNQINQALSIASANYIFVFGIYNDLFFRLMLWITIILES